MGVIRAGCGMKRDERAHSALQKVPGVKRQKSTFYGLWRLSLLQSQLVMSYDYWSHRCNDGQMLIPKESRKKQVFRAGYGMVFLFGIRDDGLSGPSPTRQGRSTNCGRLILSSLPNCPARHGFTCTCAYAVVVGNWIVFCHHLSGSIGAPTRNCRVESRRRFQSRHQQAPTLYSLDMIAGKNNNIL